ncbi:hypothetical protein [Streptomyces sp. NPDC056401]|uniref:hypothetical protein n=1 Tax=Streptomyces sp. NPDC056401 TaxID=3345809 RepID=UPI0035D6F676
MLLSSLLAVPIAALLILTTATSASAHYVYAQDEVWANADSTKCLYTYAEVSHGDGGGYTKTQANAGRDLYCIMPWKRLSGDLAAKYEYYKWDGAGWYVCALIGEWQYSTVESGQYTLSWNFGGAPPCGGGYYGTTGYTSVQYGGDWYGWNVGIWSGFHYIEP